MTSALGRRLAKLEALRKEAADRRWREGINGLLDSMSDEHRTAFWAWMDEHCGGRRIPVYPGETTPDVLFRLEPPALVRAVWLLMFEYMGGGTAPLLPPNVGDVYLLPVQTRLRADGTYRHLGVYEGECPVCGRDNHQQEVRAS